MVSFLFPNLSKYSLKFRPEYWYDEATVNVFRIKGEIRQQVATNQQDESVVSKLSTDFFHEDLKHHRLLGYAKNGSEFLGGEHLPDFLNGEMVIAMSIMFNDSLDLTNSRA